MCQLVYFGHTWCNICKYKTIGLDYFEWKDDPHWAEEAEWYKK